MQPYRRRTKRYTEINAVIFQTDKFVRQNRSQNVTKFSESFCCENLLRRRVIIHNPSIRRWQVRLLVISVRFELSQEQGMGKEDEPR